MTIYINCNTEPSLPQCCVIHTHHQAGVLTLEQVSLYVDQAQEKEGTITGHELLQKLAALPVANANVLDFYLRNQDLIPESWKSDPDGKDGMRMVFFWGTIYWHESGWPTVRFLCWVENTWRDCNRHLNGLWYRNNPALLVPSLKAPE